MKRGDYFSFTAPITDATTGLPVTGAEASLKCQFRREPDASLIAELDISETDTDGTYLFEATSTAAFPTGIIKADIQYTDGDGKVSSSETMTLLVEGDISHA
jgi:hypothetical protein